MNAKVLTLSLLTTLSHAAFGSMGEIPKDEDITPLLEGRRQITSLSVAASQGLNSGATGIDLWSGSYWPHYQGALAARYREVNFADLITKDVQFKAYKTLTDTMPLYSVNPIVLSPAEKYDLLVGDPQMTLTKYSWEVGEKALVNEKVPTWRGLCDGWASASQMMPRPVKSVTMSAPNGTRVTFTHDDIKALGSLLYARNQGPTIFLGSRCRGLFVGCAETNAGAFHRALINRVGSMKKTFIADISPGSEVWNYPVKNYSVKFYNPFTEEASSDYRSVMESFDKKKKFKKVNARHKNTKFIVGVETTVNYTDMRKADSALSDSYQLDKVLEMKYDYDLELDENGNILGGESMSRNLPDFIWAPNDETYPKAWPEKTKVARSQEELVKLSQDSAKKGQPLASIVRALFEASRE